MIKFEPISPSLSMSLRISTEDIDNAISHLENAYIEGRIDDRELEERMALALKAKTENDLHQLLQDLQTPRRAHPLVGPPKKLHRLKHHARVLFSGMEQRGHFILPKEYCVSAIMGGCVIDLSQARLESPSSTIYVTAIMGGVQILVPKGIRVEVQGTPILGGIAKDLEEEFLPDDAPVIHVFCKTIMGGIEIKTSKY
jgi:hypothetical protein